MRAGVKLEKLILVFSDKEYYVDTEGLYITLQKGTPITANVGNSITSMYQVGYLSMVLDNEHLKTRPEGDLEGATLGETLKNNEDILVIGEEFTLAENPVINAVSRDAEQALELQGEGLLHLTIK